MTDAMIIVGSIAGILLGGSAILGGMMFIDMIKTPPQPVLPQPTPALPAPPAHTVTFTVPETPYVELYDNWAVRKRADGRYAVLPLIDGAPRWEAAVLTDYENSTDAWNVAIELTRQAGQREITS